LREAELKTKETEEKLAATETALTESKTERLQHGNLFKKLQRKLLLVSKERDSYKGILDSYEHELTFSGNQFERDRLSSQEAVIKNYKEMLDKLEAQLEMATKHQTSSNAGQKEEELTEAKAKVEELKRALLDMQESRDSLQERLESMASSKVTASRTLSDDKVLHFKQNPHALAVEARQGQVDRLAEENEALKARVKLLEEGHTSNLTMLVGQKVDEGASSQEVEDLKEQLRLAEIRRERLVQAFRKTSSDFREVCQTLTGYRIDGLDGGKYRLSPIYAEQEGDHLLFK